MKIYHVIYEKKEFLIWSVLRNSLGLVEKEKKHIQRYNNGIELDIKSFDSLDEMNERIKIRCKETKLYS